MITADDLEAIKKAALESTTGFVQLIPEKSRKGMIAAFSFRPDHEMDIQPDLLLDPDDIRHVVAEVENGVRTAHVYIHSGSAWEEANEEPTFKVWDGQRQFMGMVASARGVDVLVCPPTAESGTVTRSER